MNSTKVSKIGFLLTLSLILFSGTLRAQIDVAQFSNPGKQYRPIPLWFWNNTPVEREQLLAQFRHMVEKDGYGGCAILPFGPNFAPEYMSPTYLALYESIVQEAEKMGVQMSLYDEYGFPSGSMGGYNADGVNRFMQKHPDATIKRLDKHEFSVRQGEDFEAPLPQGRLMAAVAMDTVSGRRISLKSRIRQDRLRWKAPRGAWKVMLFVCVKDGCPLVDYLDPAAVRLFIDETHEVYYKRFPRAFGKTIVQTFFDEPTLYRAGGRIWTERFNEEFEARYGFAPDLLYPALWYDIGKDTQSARNHLYGLRSALYAEGFMKGIGEWAAVHGITSTGHQDQEEIQNTVSISGDLMLCGKYMDIPGIDKIGGNRPAERFYKVISSSAYNWDKRHVMSETYGAMGNISVKQMYHIAMEQYAKGINMLIPHAVWYNDKDVTFLPELSWRNPLYRDALPAFNRFLTRLNYILQQEGRHVADIAVLYPIETLQGEHRLDGPLGYYEGGMRIPQTDYVHLSALLTDTLGRDFTYLHPEVLAEKCAVKDGLLHLQNAVNREAFRLLLVPGTKTLSLQNLRKIEAFRRAGGRVVFTTRLPEKSVEKGKDAKVQKLVARMMADPKNPARLVQHLSPEALRVELEEGIPVADVAFVRGRELNYIHKVVNGRDVYYFANLKDSPYIGEITLRGRIAPLLLNPHTGEQSRPEYSHGAETTTLHLALPENTSVFIISHE